MASKGFLQEKLKPKGKVLGLGSKAVGTAALPTGALRQNALPARSTPTFERRDTQWGASFIVRPGIAVDVIELRPTNPPPPFVKFIKGLLDKIGESKLGGGLLNEFDPSQNTFKQLPKERTGALDIEQYTGVRVAIEESKKESTIGFPPKKTGQYPLKTESLNGRTNLGVVVKGFAAADGIPLIRFPDPGASGKKLEGGAQMTSSGVKGHCDFPDGAIVPLHIALFHELCHAYLDQTGISKFLHDYNPDTERKGESPLPWKGDAANNVEEQFVCGLLAGKGVKYCENRYRYELGFPLRRSYLAVNIDKDPKLGDFDWDGPAKNLKNVLRENGYKEEDMNGLELRIRTE
jgi:hypothetical protein